MSKGSRVSKGLTGVLGEYVVGAELSRRGASITLWNTRGIALTNRRLHVSPATTRGANVRKAALVHSLVEDAYVSQHVASIRPVDSGVFAATYLWIVSPANS
jgi:hypothetical protein